MKFLVIRNDAIHRKGRKSQMNSSMFPIEVEVNSLRAMEYSSEQIVRMALDTINPGYVGMYEYVVVPMFNASVVQFRPVKPQLDVQVKAYDE